MSTECRRPELFVSYSSHDRLVAEGIVSALERDGIPCWIAPRDVIPGRPYAESIMQGLQSCRLLLLVFTSHANESPHVLREVERFVSLKQPIVCLRIENVLPAGSMEYLISATHWADAVGMDRDQYCGLALRYVGDLLRRQTESGQSVELHRGGAAGTFTPSALSGTSPVQPILAVLPIEDHTQSTAYQYLCDGVGEDVIMQLAQTSQVQVVSSHAVTLLKQQGMAAPDIAARLGAGWWLEGSMRGDGLRFRLNMRLINARTQSVAWAQAYDFETSNLFQTQQQLADQICRGLGVQLAQATGKSEERGQTRNSLALDLYFRARYQTSRRDRESLERAIALYDAAIGHDPVFVRAWARLSEVYTLCTNYGFAVTERPGARALECAERAVMLDEMVPEAQVAMGLSLRTSHFAQSAERFRLALALFPSNVEAHHYLAHVLVLMGQYHEAESENLKALAIDPLYVMARAHLARILFLVNRRDDANEQLAILEHDDYSPALVHSTRGWMRWCDGDYDAALAELTDAMTGQNHNAFDIDITADVYHRLGQVDKAMSVIREAITRQGKSHLLLARYAQLAAHRGDQPSADESANEAIGLLDALAAGWLEPRSPVYYYNLAWINAVTGKVEDSTAALVKAIESGYRHAAEINRRPDWEKVRTRNEVMTSLSESSMAGGLTAIRDYHETS